MTKKESTVNKGGRPFSVVAPRQDGTSDHPEEAQGEGARDAHPHIRPGQRREDHHSS